MSAPGYNPPNLKCHEAQGAGRDRERCSAESKAYFIGGKSYFDEDGTRISQERWRCEHGHQWLYLTRETPVQQEPKEKT